MDFEKRTTDGLDIDEFNMAKIKRLYSIHGVPVWITGDSEQEVADRYANLKYSSGRIDEPVKRSKHNFKAFAEENWRYITQTVSSTTEHDYERYLKKEILPFFNNMAIEDITWRDIQDFYDKHAELSFSTLHKWRVILSRILQIAVGDGIIQTDPTKDKRLCHSKRKGKRPVPAQETYKRIIKEIETLSEHHERLYMALVVYTGLRRGEILALKWSDISFDNDTISIVRSIDIDRTNKKRPGLLKAPKTEAGIRTIPLIPQLKDILLRNVADTEFVVTNLGTKRPLHVESEFNTMWASISRQIDLGPYTSHSYRHAMCTTLLANGVDVKTAQTIFGHSQPSTTLNIYADAIPNKVHEAGNLFSKIIAT